MMRLDTDRLKILSAVLIVAAPLLCGFRTPHPPQVKSSAPPHESSAAPAADQIAGKIGRAIDALSFAQGNPPQAGRDELANFQDALSQAMVSLNQAGAAVNRPIPQKSVLPAEIDDAQSALKQAQIAVRDALTLVGKQPPAVATDLNKAMEAMRNADSALKVPEPRSVVVPLAPGSGNAPGQAAHSFAALLDSSPMLLDLLTFCLMIWLVFFGLRHQVVGRDDSSAASMLRDLEVEARRAADRFKELASQNRMLVQQNESLSEERSRLFRMVEGSQPRPSSSPRYPEIEPQYAPADAEIGNTPMVRTTDPEPSPSQPATSPELQTSDPISAPSKPAAAAVLFGEDPERDYRDVRRKGTAELQAEFKRAYSPVTVACTNLSQRGVTGVPLTFKQEARSSLFAVEGSNRVLLFPAFAIDPAFARDTLEGIFLYPAEFAELTVVQAAQAERKGDAWFLLQPGQLQSV